MENFMNQKKFAINLTPRVNFITGKNGAGKSAILTALVLALGASARNTHRAKKMSDFIRRGHDGSAYIEVTLQNCGPEAFRPDVYGTTIGKTKQVKDFRKTLGPCKVTTLTIVRVISRTGATTYNLRDTNGVKIKASQLRYGSMKAEVDQIIDKFNIQVSNPCCVLDQETSKKFLSGGEKEKYDFFARATMIKKLEEEFETSDRTRALTMQRLDRMKESVDSLKMGTKKGMIFFGGGQVIFLS
jgi:chromosome segregation ATPase